MLYVSSLWYKHQIYLLISLDSNMMIVFYTANETADIVHYDTMFSLNG